MRARGDLVEWAHVHDHLYGTPKSFLDEMRAQEKYHQPDHWPDHGFAGGDANKAVAGVRAEDAEAFCEWRAPITPATWTVHIGGYSHPGQ